MLNYSISLLLMNKELIQKTALSVRILHFLIVKTSENSYNIYDILCKRGVLLEKYDIFISYRRDGAEFLAHNIYERLKEEGYSVFQDIESLRSGPFNTALYDVIESCQDVILILPPHGLDRCINEDDWVRNEIAYALKLNKNIIPVMMPGFEWPKTLPDDIRAVCMLNGITASTDYFNEFLKKLTSFLTSQINNHEQKKSRHSILLFLTFGIYLTGLVYPLISVFLLHQPFGLAARIVYFLWILLGALWILNRIETDPQFAAMCFGTLSEDELNLLPAQVYSKVSSVFGKNILISTEPREGFLSYYRLKRLEFGSFNMKKTNYLKIQFKLALEWYDPSVFYLHSLSKGGQAVKMLTKQGFVLQTTPPDLSPSIDYLIKKDFHIFLYYQKKRLTQAVIYNCSDEELRQNYIKE